MLKPFLADLHVHTVLSGCAEVEMIPPLIIQQAKRLGLGLIAITDHNTCNNVEAVIRASEGTGIRVLPGMEVQSREEVHSLCLFDTLLQCRQWQEVVFRRLPSLTNKEEIFGAQFMVNATGEFLRTEQRLLATSTDMDLKEVVAEVHSRGGMVIPAHVDRPSFSLLTNLGFVPDSLDVEALEVTRHFTPSTGWKRWPELKSWCLIVDGDAHRLQEMQNRTLFKMAAPRVEEIHLALKGEQGRRVVIEWPTPCQIS